MTALIDRFWIGLGVNAEELEAMTARRALYVGMITMTVAASCVVGGIATNVATMMVA